MPLRRGPVQLVAPTHDGVRAVETGEVDENGAWSRWFDAAEDDGNMVYFSIERNGSLVGEIFLHDIDAASATAMIGYRVFADDQRGRGTGSAALASLVDWVRDATSLKELFILTRRDNAASRGLADAAGFEFMGAAREDNGRVVYRMTLSRPCG